jgi:hypothetical protein
MGHRNRASAALSAALLCFALLLAAAPAAAQVNVRLQVAYHSQIPPGDPNVPANWPWAEPGNPALPNGYCTCACLDMLFNYATSNMCPHNNPPLPQKEFAAVANTNDCMGGGSYCGTYLTDARRAVHFSPATAAWPCNPPPYVPNGQKGYTWPLVWQAPGPQNRYGMVGIEGNWTAHGWTRQQFKQVLMAGWPIMVNVVGSAVADSLPGLDPEDSDTERTDYDEVENTVVGHSIVVRGVSDAMNTFLIHDPTLGPALMINQNTFWNTWWVSKDFLVVFPWTTAINVPVLGSLVPVNYQTSATATYNDFLPATGSGAAVTTKGKLSFFPTVGQQQNSALAQNQAATINFNNLLASGQFQQNSWQCVTQAHANGTHAIAETWGRVSTTAHSFPGGYIDDIGSMTRTIVVVPAPIAGDVSICHIPRQRWWIGAHVGCYPGVFPPGMPNDFIMEIENRGVATVGNVAVQLYYSDPTLVENVPGIGMPFGSTTVPAIAPGQTVETSPVAFMPPTSNSFGQHYYTFGVRAQCAGDVAHDQWVEFDNDLACKAEHRVQVAPFSGTYLHFWAANPRSEAAYVVVKMKTYLPGIWSAQLAPAGMDSVLLPAGAQQQHTLYVDAGPVGIGMVDVYELMYDTSGRFLNTAGGLSFLVWTTGTDVPDGDAPIKAALAAPWPNPAAGTTELAFTLPADCDATLSVYDASGRLVARPFSGPAAAGPTQVEWDCRDSDGQDLASGVYFVKLEAAGRADVRKLVVVR